MQEKCGYRADAGTANATTEARAGHNRRLLSVKPTSNVRLSGTAKFRQTTRILENLKRSQMNDGGPRRVGPAAR